MHTALILFAHGARDPAWSVPLAALAQAVQVRDASLQVSTAFLEIQSPTLEVAVADACAHGARVVRIVPVFWARAGHVAKDLDPAVEQLRRAYPQVRFELMPVLSELPGMIEFIAGAITPGAITQSPVAPRSDE